MTPTQSIAKASTAVSRMRRLAAEAEGHLHLASQLVPMPETFPAMLEDMESLQRCLGRLHAQVHALDVGAFPSARTEHV